MQGTTQPYQLRWMITQSKAVLGDDNTAVCVEVEDHMVPGSSRRLTTQPHAFKEIATQAVTTVEATTQL